MLQIELAKSLKSWGVEYFQLGTLIALNARPKIMQAAQESIVGHC
jgi:hypothetical protein